VCLAIPGKIDEFAMDRGLSVGDRRDWRRAPQSRPWLVAGMKVLTISAKLGEGMEAFLEYLKQQEITRSAAVD
jgi:hypothetical protein